MVLPLLAHLLLSLFARGVLFDNILIHGIAEIGGAVLSVLVAGILFYRSVRESSWKFLWLSCAFFAMGIFDFIHGLTSPGNSFVWLHSLAVFVGGLFFSFTLFTKSEETDSSVNKGKLYFVLFVVIALALGISIFSVIAGKIPTMLLNGEFTLTANMLNLVGGALFLISAFSLLNTGFEKIKPSIFTLAFLASLFGGAGLLFSLSGLWDISWWVWHVLRIVAYVIAIIFIVSDRKEERLEEEDVGDKLTKEEVEE